MPIDTDSGQFESKEEGLYNLAVKLGDNGMFCSCCALIWTDTEIHGYARRHMSHLDSKHLEGLIYIYTRFRQYPKKFDHLNKSAILGHALILRVMGIDAVHQIAEAYLSDDNNSNNLCTALLLWIGDNPELKEVGDKIVISQELANKLTIRSQRPF